MPFQFNIEGPETRRARELQQRLQELQARRLEVELDPQAQIRQQTQIAEAASQQAFDPNASPAAQAVGQRMLGQTVGMQKVPGTNLEVPMGTPSGMLPSLLQTAVSNVKALRSYADMATDPEEKRIYSDLAVSAEKGLNAKAKELSATDLAFEGNAAAALRYADQFENLIDQYGTFEIVSPRGSALLGQIPLQMAISYAKIVDPSSVAREGEVQVAKKYMLPGTDGVIDQIFTRPETAKQAIQNFRNDVMRRAEDYSRATGRNLNFKAEKQMPQRQQEQQGQQAQGVIPLVRDASGRFVPAR